MLNMQNNKYYNDFVHDFLSKKNENKRIGMLQDIFDIVNMPGWGHIISYLDYRSDIVVGEMINISRDPAKEKEVFLMFEYLRVVKDINQWLSSLKNEYVGHQKRMLDQAQKQSGENS